MPKTSDFKALIKGKYGAKMKLFTPAGGSLDFSGPMTQELAEFTMMAVAVGPNMPASMRTSLAAMTLELQNKQAAPATTQPQTKLVEVQVLRCQHCPVVAIAIEGTRITGHKCVGAWDILRQEKIEVSRIEAVFNGTTPELEESNKNIEQAEKAAKKKAAKKVRKR